MWLWFVLANYTGMLKSCYSNHIHPISSGKSSATNRHCSINYLECHLLFHWVKVEENVRETQLWEIWQMSSPCHAKEQHFHNTAISLGLSGNVHVGYPSISQNQESAAVFTVVNIYLCIMELWETYMERHLDMLFAVWQWKHFADISFIYKSQPEWGTDLVLCVWDDSKLRNNNV